MSDRLNESLNDLRRVYLDSVAGNYLTEQHEYLNYIEEKKKSKLDPVGEEDDDIDNDEDVDDSDSYLKHRRNVVTSEVEDESEEDEDDDEHEEENNKKSHKKKKKLKEYFSNWRSDLYEVVGDIDSEIEDQRQIKENPKIRNTVKINPTINIGEQLGAESIDVEEIDINEVIDIASEYFYANGLNESGIDLVIEQLGEEQFTEFVFDLAEDYYLFEELGESNNNKDIGRRIKDERRYFVMNEATRSQAPTTSSPNTTRDAIFRRIQQSIGDGLKRHRDATTLGTKIAQKALPPLASGFAHGFGGSLALAKRFLSGGTESSNKKADGTSHPTPVASSSGSSGNYTGRRHRRHGRVIPGAQTSPKPITKSSDRRYPTEPSGQTTMFTEPVPAKSVGIEVNVPPGGRRKLSKSSKSKPVEKTTQTTLLRKKEFRLEEDFGNWVNRLIDEGYDISDFTVNELYERYEYLVEKSVSEQQQKLFGLALSVKRGKTPRSEVSAEVLKIVDEMSEAEIRKFAKTKHEGLPKRAEED